MLESVGHSTHSLTVNNQFLYFCTSETFLQAVMFSFIVWIILRNRRTQPDARAFWLLKLLKCNKSDSTCWVQLITSRAAYNNLYENSMSAFRIWFLNKKNIYCKCTICFIWRETVFHVLTTRTQQTRWSQSSRRLPYCGCQHSPSRCPVTFLTCDGGNGHVCIIAV